MLTRYITQFLDYCQTANFAAKSLQTLRLKLTEFAHFLHARQVHFVRQIHYSDVAAYITSGENPSLHTKKARIWTLRLFFHFLKLHNVIDENPAKGLRYPQIRKTIPRYLTSDQYLELIEFFSCRCRTTENLQHLLVILLLGLFGLRLSTLLRMNIEHVDLEHQRFIVFDKGHSVRILHLPAVLVRLLQIYISFLGRSQGALFLTQRRARLNTQTVHLMLRMAMKELGLNHKLHSHLFRHTAATQLNRVAGLDVVQHLLGHSRWENTLHYAHLNPDVYATYMKRHPYHSIKE